MTFGIPDERNGFWSRSHGRVMVRLSRVRLGQLQRLLSPNRLTMVTPVDSYSGSAKIIDGTAIAKSLCMHFTHSTVTLTVPIQVHSR